MGMTEVDREVLPSALRPREKKEVLGTAFFWLCAFYFVYCGRPEDWVSVLYYIPLAKITSLLALLSLLMAAGKSLRKFKDLPREATYLLIMIGLMYVSGFLSPVWRGGAVMHALEFSKVYVAWVLTFLLITTFARLRRIIFIQAASVAVISAIAIVKGRQIPRLNGVINGIYSNPNDLAFAIVLCIPLAMAFLVRGKGILRKTLWGGLMLAMLAALFLTASRAGFINLLISGTVCLWHFGVKGRRFHLIVGTALISAVLLLLAGGRLEGRLAALTSGAGETQVQNTAYGSYEERRLLMVLALEGIMHHPLLGIGAANFGDYTGLWKQVHASYLQIAVEGGIPVLILYLMFFRRGFANLKALRKRRDLDAEIKLFAGALHSMLIGFVVGAWFAPEAYQFFPYFAVCYTSVLFAIVQEQESGRNPAMELASPARLRSETYGEKRPSRLYPVH